MKRRNLIAMQASGYTVSGSFAVASTVSLLSGKAFSSMFYGALSALTAAAVNEMTDHRPAPSQAEEPVVTDSAPRDAVERKSSSSQETATTSGSEAAA